MARKARLHGLLARNRELTSREREIVDRALDEDAGARELLRRFERQDALLRALPAPRLDPAVTARIMAETVHRRDSAPVRARRPVFAVALALLVMMLVGGTAAASSASLPGDALYPFKRVMEQARLTLTLREETRARYAEHLGEVRSREVGTLLDLGREGIPVEFTGALEQSGAGEWSVAGIPVALPDDAGAAPGQSVHVVGETGQERVQVLMVIAETPGEGPAHGSEPAGSSEGAHSGDTPGPSHTPGVPQGQGPTSHESDDAPAEDEALEPPANTPVPHNTRKPEHEAEDETPSGAPAKTPPGLEKRNTVAPNTNADGETHGERVTPMEGPTATPEPTSPGGSNKDPDGSPDPTRRPPQAEPTDQNEPEGQGSTVEEGRVEAETPESKPSESKPTKPEDNKPDKHSDE